MSLRPTFRLLSILIAEVIFNILELIELKLNLILKFPLLSLRIFLERKEIKIGSEKYFEKWLFMSFLDFKLSRLIWEKELNIVS